MRIPGSPNEVEEMAFCLCKVNGNLIVYLGMCDCNKENAMDERTGGRKDERTNKNKTKQNKHGISDKH